MAVISSRPYTHFLTARNPTLLPRGGNKYSVRSSAYMRAPPGANSPDIIVDVRVMHALHLHVVRAGAYMREPCARSPAACM